MGRGSVRAVVSEGRLPGHSAGGLFSDAVGGLLRGDQLTTGHRLAVQRFAVAAEVSLDAKRTLLGAVGVFAFQNQQIVTLDYLDRSLSCPLALLVGIAYGLGMLSGWTILGLFRQSVQRVSEPPSES